MNLHAITIGLTAGAVYFLASVALNLWGLGSKRAAVAVGAFTAAFIVVALVLL